MLLSNRKAVTVHGLSGNIGFWFLFFCHITRISAICVNLDLSFSQYLTVFFKVITINISNMHHMFYFPQCLVQITFQFLYLANFHQKYFHCFCVKACL